MSEELVVRLSGESTESQKTWLVTQLVLSSLPPNAQEAALASAIPHWFNPDILAALLAAGPGEAAELDRSLSDLSFAEPFGGLGHAFHDLTRRAILSHLLEHNVALVRTVARSAYEYFRKYADSQNSVEADYHLLLIDKSGGLEKFKRDMRLYRRAANFSAADNMIRNAKELSELGALDEAERPEIELNEYLLGATRIWRSRYEPSERRAHLREAIRIFALSDSLGSESRQGDEEEFAKQARITFVRQKLNDARQKGDDRRQRMWLVELGSAEVEAGKAQEALSHINAALDRDPDNVEALIERGRTHRALNEREAAVTDFNRAIELDEKGDWAIANRGVTYQQMGRFEDALADFNRAIALDDKYAFAITCRGLTCQQMGRYEDALADFNRAIALDEKDVWAIASRGETYRRMGRYEDALADLNRAIELDEKDAFAITCRGLTCQQMGRYEDALADFNRAIALDEKDAGAIASRGETYQQMGRYEDAMADFNRAIELDEKYAWAITSRGETYRRMGRYEDALADLNRAIELGHEDGWEYYLRGLVAVASGTYEAAKNHFLKAMECSRSRDQSVPMTAFNSGLYNLALGRTTEAETIYETALNSHPTPGAIREVILDLDQFLGVFPSDAAAISMRNLLAKALQVR